MNRCLVSARMVARETLRNRTGVSLLFLVPTVLYALILATTADHPFPYQLSADVAGLAAGSERNISLLFMGSTAMCGLLAFVGFVLTWRPIQTDRRLVFEGFRPWELLAAKTLVVASASAIVALYVTCLLLLFYQPLRVAGVFLGFFLAGLAYALVGIATGLACRRDLDGILAILLLVNVDPGWLENPVFYAHAHNRQIIHWLPAHHPCQVAMLSALTRDRLLAEVLMSGAWLLALGLLAAFLYMLRVGVVRRAARP